MASLFFGELQKNIVLLISQKNAGLYGRHQPVEKPALAIRPEQVFCLKTRRQVEKAMKCGA
ncbi:hypothetical protein B5G38_12760, partial [Gemmiger sp. An87]